MVHSRAVRVVEQCHPHPKLSDHLSYAAEDPHGGAQGFLDVLVIAASVLAEFSLGVKGRADVILTLGSAVLAFDPVIG